MYHRRKKVPGSDASWTIRITLTSAFLAYLASKCPDEINMILSLLGAN